MKYAQLIRLLVNRELTLRYKRSVIGIGWTLLNPMLTSAVLWYVFSFVFASKLPSGPTVRAVSNGRNFAQHIL
jgi:ABC-type polysaccharide/polyol phosphate export permease